MLEENFLILIIIIIHVVDNPDHQQVHHLREQHDLDPISNWSYVMMITF